MDLTHTLTALANSKAPEFSESSLRYSIVGFSGCSPAVTLILQRIKVLLAVTAVSRATSKISVCRILGKTGMSALFKLTSEGHDPKVRKLAVRLVCELVHENEETQQFVCDCFGFTPLQGRICINKMPSAVKDSLYKNARLIYALRESDPADRKRKYWCFPAFPLLAPIQELVPTSPTIADDLARDYPDPLEYWIGFVCTLPQPKHKQNHSVFIGIKEKLGSPAKTAAKQAVKSFVSNVSKSPHKEHKRQITAVPVKAVVIQEEEKHLESLQDESFQDVVVEEEDSVETSPHFVSAGSGSESAAKFRFSLASRQTPLLADHGTGCKEQTVSRAAPGKKLHLNLDKLATATGKAKAKVHGSRQLHEPAKTARDSHQKDLSTLKAAIEKQLTIKAGENKSRPGKVADNKKRKLIQRLVIEVLSFIANTRKSVGGTNKLGPGKKPV